MSVIPYHEIMIHPVLYTHAAPRNVVIIDSTDPIGPAEGLFSQPFTTTACVLCAVLAVTM
ncbi:MAG: hypothetical protein L3J88_00940 [Gammaproteobacteria bacterium]|nr:hypothetical protein [Gammaproteobacteria bacterium]MCF6361934.1 hypothetical protein [Gammaproteobacteria bacterium]